MAKITRAQFLRGRWQEAPLPPSSEVIAKIGRTCLPIRGESCRICGNLCELNAIRFIQAEGQLPVPVIVADECTGCGDCLGICPVDAIDMKQRQPEDKS
ncbi:MAG: 4Fe-4S dicluster domain-containing protein [Gammaproteobacteria bacterium]|nr:4Fe-4S dicluster domain-containing protein [Gammaproteobacteria bacterium]MCP4088270.1 4Fe-4S dicluster domain-containing protein [Gammaproteobacteria bacterium]MCP4276419.1 4Fe-4S dicluster domain-containing protein [Gammaproteobacteria bacterium]MCP4831066.1 4Fe-4S dicluster domain-containing protein [Gammaproteobacteria bacterium]MCP4929334.1 4Fe-4S dicluster domain-containing protein [Gammaproteobacteria bacterium]